MNQNFIVYITQMQRVDQHLGCEGSIIAAASQTKWNRDHVPMRLAISGCKYTLPWQASGCKSVVPYYISDEGREVEDTSLIPPGKQLFSLVFIHLNPFKSEFTIVIFIHYKDMKKDAWMHREGLKGQGGNCGNQNVLYGISTTVPISRWKKKSGFYIIPKYRWNISNVSSEHHYCAES